MLLNLCFHARLAEKGLGLLHSCGQQFEVGFSKINLGHHGFRVKASTMLWRPIFVVDVGLFRCRSRNGTDWYFSSLVYGSAFSIAGSGFCRLVDHSGSSFLLLFRPTLSLVVGSLFRFPGSCFFVFSGWTKTLSRSTFDGVPSVPAGGAGVSQHFLISFFS